MANVTFVLFQDSSAPTTVLITSEPGLVKNFLYVRLAENYDVVFCLEVEKRLTRSGLYLDYYRKI